MAINLIKNGERPPKDGSILKGIEYWVIEFKGTLYMSFSSCFLFSSYRVMCANERDCHFSISVHCTINFYNTIECTDVFLFLSSLSYQCCFVVFVVSEFYFHRHQLIVGGHHTIGLQLGYRSLVANLSFPTLLPSSLSHKQLVANLSSPPPLPSSLLHYHLAANFENKGLTLGHRGSAHRPE
jgi:hypothetical protein